MARMPCSPYKNPVALCLTNSRSISSRERAIETLVPSAYFVGISSPFMLVRTIVSRLCIIGLLWHFQALLPLYSSPFTCVRYVRQFLVTCSGVGCKRRPNGLFLALETRCGDLRHLQRCHFLLRVAYRDALQGGCKELVFVFSFAFITEESAHENEEQYQ